MPQAQETLSDKENSIMQGETSTFISNSSNQYKGENKMSKQRIALSLFWIGLLIAVVFAGINGGP